MRYDPWYRKLNSYLSDKWVASITMYHGGGVESHGVKYTHTEKMDGPENRIWTANKLWSGTSMVEAGIHQTDLMRFWASDDIKWVQAAYTERPKELMLSWKEFNLNFFSLSTIDSTNDFEISKVF